MVDVITAIVGVLWLIGVVLLSRDLDSGWLRWVGVGALLVFLAGGLGWAAWEHRPRNDQARLHDWLDASGCASVSDEPFAASDGREPGLSERRLVLASVGGTVLECNNVSGYLRIVRLTSAASLRAGLASDAPAQRSTYCVKGASVTFEHLVQGNWMTFRHWCRQLHGRYHKHASRPARA